MRWSSTGVDARNVRNIVLMRPVGSMIEFKQIIGRGTRLFDGKDYFTIYDFVKAHQHLLGMICFVHQHYVTVGVEELEQEKLTPLLRLKYGAIQDAVADLGQPEEIGKTFAGFQRFLYA